VLDFRTFLENLKSFGLEHFSIRRFYGSYRAQVTRNDDPEGRGRVQVLCPGFAGNQAMNVWLDAAAMSSGPDRGFFNPPEVGDWVWIQFENGDANWPHLYFGGFFTTSIPSAFAYTGSGAEAENKKPEARGFISRKGHQIIWSDEDGNESLKILWHRTAPGDDSLEQSEVSSNRGEGNASGIMFMPNGDVVIFNKNGTRVHLDAENKRVVVADENSNIISTEKGAISVVCGDGKSSVSLDNGKVTVIGSSEVAVTAPSVNLKSGGVYLGDAATLKAVLGEPLLAWLNTHVHLTAFGPSTPPVVPAPPTLLSNSVKVKI
jgi:hypothetical protein